MQAEEIVKAIREKIGEWDKVLWSFTSSKDMKDIIEQLIEIKNSRKFSVPSLPDAVHVYSLVRPSKVRCIILTSLKGNSKDLVDGNKVAMQPYTETIRAVLETICNPIPEIYHWSTAQGVLQICITPTSTLNGDHHTKIWAKWTAYVINKLNELYIDIPWIVIGKNANQYLPMIKSENKFTVQTWPTIEHNDCWNKANKVLIQQGKKPIVWEYKKVIKGTITKKEARIRRIERAIKKRNRKTKK